MAPAHATYLRRMDALGRQILKSGNCNAAPSASSFTLQRLTPGMGAEVWGFDFAKLLADEKKGDKTLIREIDDALMQHKVLHFRDAKLDRQTHLEFMACMVRYWGLDDPSKLGPNGTEASQARQILGPHGLIIDPFLPQIKGFEEVWPVDFASEWGRVKQGVEEIVNKWQRDAPYGGRKAGPIARGAQVWHSDQVFFEQPSAVTSLRAVRLPKVGGDTLFANMEQAYEDLDDRLKAELEELICKNRQPLMTPFQRYADETGDRAYYEWLKETFKETKTPMVRIHPVTKKKALFVSKGYTDTIEQADGKVLDPVESRNLITKLTDLAKVPEYQLRIRHRTVGDLLIWDNRSVVHYAVADWGDEATGGGPRWMDHITTSGTTPQLGVPS